MLAGSDQLITTEDFRIVGCFGYEPYYFMLRKDNKELLKEIDYALDIIFANDSSYVHKLHDKHYGSLGLNSTPTFTREEIELINKNKKQNKAITIAMITDSQPDAYHDENGEIIGILPEIMDLVSEMSGLKFNYTFSPSDKPPLEYIKENPDTLAGGVLITNPAFEKADVIVSNQVYVGYSGLLVNSDIKDVDIENKEYKIGIQPVFQAMNLYIKKHYPNLTVVNDYKNTEENLEALNRGDIDVFAYDINMVLHYLGNPRYDNIRIASTSFMQERQGIVAMNTAENNAYMTIINKCLSLIPQETISVIERYHVSNNFYTPSFGDVLFRLRIPLVVCAILVLIIIALLVRGGRRAKRNELNIQIKNEQLLEAVEQAEHANRAKGEFFSCMSHDIRTPMNAIMGMSELALSNTQDPQRTSEYLKKINYSANHLTTMINDILDMSKIESGKMHLKISEFSMVESINTTVTMIRNMAFDKKIGLSVHTHNCSQEHLIGDELKLNQVCINLLSNAIKYTKPGGHVSYDFYQEDIPDKPEKVLIKMVISDNGIGMSEEFQKTMYESFERGLDRRTNSINGSGLGLYICKQFMEIMDGKIECQSTLGKGTTFTVSVELERGEQDTQSKLPPIKVLVVDHDEKSTNSLGKILSRLGVEYVAINECDTMINGLNDGRLSDFDLAFVEMMCPDNKGIKIVQYIRELSGKQIPVVLTDIADMLVFSNEIKDANIKHTMNKPYFYSTVYKTICDILSLKDDKNSSNEKSDAPLAGLRILIAEDNDTNAEIFREILKMNGACSERAENGQICLDMLNEAEQGRYAAVLMDVRMPVMGGIEATKQIRQSETEWISSIPIIAMTADAFAEDMNKCFEAGMNFYLQKPIDTKKMISTLQKINK